MKRNKMNRKIKISDFQLLCMIFMFELGAPIPIEIYKRAKQDTWISLILGLVIGCLLLYVIIKLNSFFPEIPFTKYIQHILGKYIGKVLALIYIVYFIYYAALVLRNCEDILVVTLYSSSSLISIGILMMLLMMYALYKGFETFARANEFMFFVSLFFILLFIGLEMISNIINFNNLRPVLENGWEPVLKATPLLVSNPFGEIFIFTMILPNLTNQKKAIKVGISSLLLYGVIVTILSILNISILGVSEIERTIYPFLTSVSYINIADIIQKLDTFLVILTVYNFFIKITVYFYCAVSGSAELFGVKRSSDLIYPIAIIVLICSLWLAPNYIEQRIKTSEIVPFLLQLPLQIVIPVILLIIVLIRRKLRGKKLVSKSV
ncbi:spore gernimation protein [Bacillus sp. AFS002410]|uniref:GerAB/ArcD/ProY family transporter n=1 Tax=Bacillus sp. AFS002410 TaxID=2033481 RepID=UPI000BF1EE85|nr:endospore germination permease [Bacillus sp. AFS002410]PEJ57613.1 spore gernimation protein [Bacillus sp. AFS002410]